MYCPKCYSSDIYFIEKMKRYICENCEHVFIEPATEVKREKIFVSYGHDKNAVIVNRIVEFLKQNGYDVWIDTSNIRTGDDWRKQITEGIMQSNQVLSFLSKHSVRTPGVCLDELRIAMGVRHAYIHSILLEKENEVNPPASMRSRQWLDLSDWKQVSENTPEVFDSWLEERMLLLLEVLQNESTLKFQDEVEKIFQKLKPVNNDAKRNKLFIQEYVEREWLENEIEEWKSDESSERIFAILGTPGTGKSRFLVNYVHYRPDILAYIFFEWDNLQLQNPVEIIKLLTFQFAMKLPDYRCIINELLEANDKLIEDTYSLSLLKDILITDPLQKCIDGSRNIWLIVLDGLDETTPEVVDLILKIIEKLPNWIRVLVTSRPINEIETLLCESHTVLINQECERNKEDIQKYIGGRLNREYKDELVQVILGQTEGAFMLAKLYCDSVEKGEIKPETLESIPKGLSGYYHSFFEREFYNTEEYQKIRPLLEVMCAEESGDINIICTCLELDRYEFFEYKKKINSFVYISEEQEKYWPNRTYRTIRFIHKSLRDWLVDEQKAGRFYIDEDEGYKRLAKSALRKQYYFNATTNYSEEYEKKCIAEWLCKAKMWDEYHDLLMQTKTDSGSWSPFWYWADEFPKTYPIEDLVEKAKILARAGWGLLADGMNSHKQFMECYRVFLHCLKTGRYKVAFEESFRGGNLFGYFRSGFSDKFELHDGYDKIWIMSLMHRCILECKKNGISVSKDVMKKYQMTKVTCVFENGKADFSLLKDYMEGADFMLKDLFTLDDNEILLAEKFPDIRALRTEYNTICLENYLFRSDEEDLDYIQACKVWNANVENACLNALEKLGTVRNKDVQDRITFVMSVFETYK